ncbi:MAG: 1,6-anhydro-N-acetylmuramyl-L-alanine amidase AmpD, partial [Gammaproteobacteria bacterium]
MQALDAQGWLRGVRHAPSPNYDARPDPADIQLMVIHNISLPPGEFGGGLVEPFFCNTLDVACHPALQELAGVTVSDHFLIDRDGEVTQFVSTHDRAWHAG